MSSPPDVGALASTFRDKLPWRSDTQQQDTAADGVAQVYDQFDANEETIDRALALLQESEQDVTLATLTETIDAMQEVDAPEGTGDEVGSTGVVRTDRERRETDRVNVAPEKVVENEDHRVLINREGEEIYCRGMIIPEYPYEVVPGWLDKLFAGGLEETGADVRTSIHLTPRDTKWMKKKLTKKATRVTGQLKRKKEKKNIDVLDEQEKLGEINDVRTKLTRGTTKLFDFGLYIDVYAEDKRTLDKATNELKQLLSEAQAVAVPLYDRQLAMHKTMAPIGTDSAGATTVMDLDSLGTVFPFIEQCYIEPGGLPFGFKKSTNAPVILDPFQRSGHDILIAGKKGSGKTFMSKNLMLHSHRVNPDMTTLIIDPAGDGFDDFVEALEGQIVRINNETVINPMEIKPPEGEMDITDLGIHPYDNKIRSLMGMFNTLFSGAQALEKHEEGVLRRAIRLAYLQRGITKDIDTHHNESPVIADVNSILSCLADGQHPEQFLNIPPNLDHHLENIDFGMESDRNRDKIQDIAHRLQLGLEQFRPGGQHDNLNGQSTVDLRNNVVLFDISNVADAGNEALFMHLALDWLFQRAKAQPGRVRIAIDEAHYLLRDPHALQRLNIFSRHARHYTTGLTLISQTIDEFVEQGERREIYSQCDIRVLMRHQDINETAADAVGLTQREQQQLTRLNTGENSDHSEAIVFDSETKKKRQLRILTNGFDQSLIDEDLSAWNYLYENTDLELADVPEQYRSEAKYGTSGLS